MSVERIPIEDLSSLALNTTISFSWDVESYEYEGEKEGGGWQFWESVLCPGELPKFGVFDPVDDEFIDGARTHEIARQIICDAMGAGTYESPDELEIREHPDDHYTDGSGFCTHPACTKFEELIDVYREGPMMSYYYPFQEPYRFDPLKDAVKIADLPLCIVKVGEQYGLALTGGGMDLSWEICEAFTRLGMLPPTNMVDLPNMAGKRRSERNLYIVEACREAVRREISYLGRRLERLDEAQKKLET